MEIEFSNPNYLWFLILIPLINIITLLIISREKKLIKKIISFRALEFIFKGDIFKGKYAKRKILVSAFRTLIYAIIVFALANPTLWHKGKARDVSTALLIDISGSMLGEDIKPNRLGAIKEHAKEIVDGIPGNRIALISFSGNAYTEKDFSSKEQIIKKIKSLEISKIPGTSIGIALREGAKLLLKKEKDRNKLIILVTDGGENVLPKQTLYKIIESLKNKHINLFVIGIGKTEGKKFPGTEVPSRINEELLSSIAKKIDGNYIRVRTSEEIKDAFNKINKIKVKKSINLRVVLIIIAIALLIFDWGFIRSEYVI